MLYEVITHADPLQRRLFSRAPQAPVRRRVALRQRALRAARGQGGAGGAHPSDPGRRAPRRSRRRRDRDDRRRLVPRPALPRRRTAGRQPKVDSANGSSGVKVNFQNITYNTNNNTQVMVDTTTASCDCRFSSDYAGGGVSKLTTIPATPESLDGLLYWNTKQDNKSYWGVYANSNLTPPEYSVSATQSQTSVCDACCENHFKGSGSTLESYYNPFT